MFKKLFMTALLIVSIIAAKADDDQKITSKVQKVVVFLSGAQVTRTATVNISAGTTDLIFENISPDIDPQSIQVNAGGEFTILSVKHETNFLNEKVKVKEVEDLRTIQKTIQNKIDLQNAMLEIYKQEETVLAKNQVVKADNASLDVLKLKEALDFQTERLTSLKIKEQTEKNQIEALQNDLQKYNQQIVEINREQNPSTTNIIVTVSSKTALQSIFTLSYLIHDANWYPSYDIRAKNVNSPLTIVYKANVSQTSGEDWKNVKLTLSTGSPTVSGVKPELNPYYINVISQYLQGRAAGVSLSEVVVEGYAAKDKTETADISTVPVAVNQVENQTNFEFNIDNPYSVSSDGKQSQVEINQVSVNANYQYYVAPKLSTNVFLTAQITDWNKYNFLSGEANLFFEGTYVGKSVLNTQSVADTLCLSLGTDKNIVVTRNLQKNLTEKQTLGSNRKETKSWQIEIKNRKNQKINLLVEDQVPVSQNKDIEVEVQESTGVKPDALTGKVSWNFLLNSQDNKKLNLRYQVKYPKSQSIILQ